MLCRCGCDGCETVTRNHPLKDGYCRRDGDGMVKDPVAYCIRQPTRGCDDGNGIGLFLCGTARSV